MTVEELTKARLKLQADIAAQLYGLLSDFKAKTGVGVRELEVLTMDVSTMISNTREIIVSGAIVRLDI